MKIVVTVKFARTINVNVRQVLFLWMDNALKHGVNPAVTAAFIHVLLHKTTKKPPVALIAKIQPWAKIAVLDIAPPDIAKELVNMDLKPSP